MSHQPSAIQEASTCQGPSSGFVNSFRNRRRVTQAVTVPFRAVLGSQSVKPPSVSLLVVCAELDSHQPLKCFIAFLWVLLDFLCLSFSSSNWLNPLIVARGFVSNDQWFTMLGNRADVLVPAPFREKRALCHVKHFAVFMPSTSHQKQYFFFCFSKTIGHKTETQ